MLSAAPGARLGIGVQGLTANRPLWHSPRIARDSAPEKLMKRADTALLVESASQQI